jgi:hypothetical protein
MANSIGHGGERNPKPLAGKARLVRQIRLQAQISLYAM